MYSVIEMLATNISFPCKPHPLTHMWNMIDFCLRSSREVMRCKTEKRLVHIQVSLVIPATSHLVRGQGEANEKRLDSQDYIYMQVYNIPTIYT